MKRRNQSKAKGEIIKELYGDVLCEFNGYRGGKLRYTAVSDDLHSSTGGKMFELLCVPYSSSSLNRIEAVNRIVFECESVELNKN